jgi:hypothetical protein
MKVRNGFVSNSSTSSFCIYGAEVSGTDEAALIKKIQEAFPDATIRTGCGMADICDQLAKRTALEFHGGSECGSYIGKSWCNIGDEETGKQFKATVEATIKKFFGDGIKCGTVEEAWYNG